MSWVVRRLVAMLSLGRAARNDVWWMLADLLDAGLPLENALGVSVAAARDQGQGMRAWALERWREALLADRFRSEVGRWVPASEAMVFQAYGRVGAGSLCGAAARVAESQGRQVAAVWKAVALPSGLSVFVLALLWASGAEMIPILESVSPRGQWGFTARVFAGMSLFVYDDVLAIVVFVAAAVGAVVAVMLNWTGRGRVLLDRVAPFSLYRTVTGTAFLLVVMEFVRVGVDLNDQVFEALKRVGSPYVRSRIGVIQAGMARGAGMGRAMVEARHGFPDPSLVPVVAALESLEGWEDKLGLFVDRWAARSSRLIETRAAVVNGLLLSVVALVTGVGVHGMFSIMSAGGGVR